MLRKHQVIRSSRIDGTIVIGRSIRLATETVLKTVEPEQGLGSSTLPPPATNNRGFRRSDTGFICQLGEGSLPSAASQNNAGIVQLVEHLISTQDVASSSLAVRSTFRKPSANHVHNLTYFKYLRVRVLPSDYFEVVELVDTSNKTVSC